MFLLRILKKNFEEGIQITYNFNLTQVSWNDILFL